MTSPLETDCLCVGILVADHLCDPLARLPQPGELVVARRLQLAVGGCAANAAIGLSRLGYQAAVVGCVGDDPLGQFLVGSLAIAGIAVEPIRRVTADTSASLVLNVTGEDRRFVHAVGANAMLTVDDVAPSLWQNTKVLYVGGYLMLPGLTPDSLADLFRRARAAGAKTVLDVVLSGTSGHWERLAPVLPYTDVFLPNRDEAAAITGLEDPLAQAERLLEAGAKTVVITCGELGCLLATDDTRLRCGVYPTLFAGGTGAGDAFDAAYIAGLLAGNDPEGCLRWGSALGASCVRSTSATDSLFTRQEALEFMASHSLRVERLQQGVGRGIERIREL